MKTNSYSSMSSLSGSWAIITGRREVRGMLATATTINLHMEEVRGTRMLATATTINLHMERGERYAGHGHNNKPEHGGR